MGMLAAWSILNKVAHRADARFSDTVVAVCPNVTIRNRLGELDPLRGAASIYRTRDLVPERLMADLAQGRVIIVNWHVFEPQAVNVGGTSAKVARAGVEVRTRETIKIAAKTTTMRGSRYITLQDLEKQTAAGIITVLEEIRDKDGSLREVKVEAVGGHGLAFLRGGIEHKDLWLMDPETGAERQLTNLPGDFDIRDFDISPDGREVVLERVQERSDIVLLDLARQ